MNYLHTQGQQIFCGNQPLQLRGMGLGGWLLPEGYMWKLYTKCDRPRRMEALIQTICGAEYAESFWTRYYDSYITEEDIAWIAAQGLNSVRLALNARHLFRVEGNAVSFDQRGVSYVDRCLRWCKKYRIYLFLDMHAAPGGQTGQNIDDSERDMPELFMEQCNQDILIEMWRLLAGRYHTEPAIGGYDLLNEPLPKWNNEYNSRLLPLYRKLIQEIRLIDQQHIIILEGLHWATDFSAFDMLSPGELGDNIVLQFHKYWSDPDEESLAPFLTVSRRLNLPLWMGEGGENNLEWYTYIFPLYERLGIGWCFWCYKKMSVPNSPATFEEPAEWQRLIDYIDGKNILSQWEAREIFDAFLDGINSTEYHPEVIHALLRRAPLTIPAAAFDAEMIQSQRIRGAVFRMNSKATILFADGHCGPVDWRRYVGEPQPEEQKLLVRLRRGDRIAYQIDRKELGAIRVCADHPDILHLQQDGNLLWLCCEGDSISIESIRLLGEETPHV